jgi:hypothetical protein
MWLELLPPGTILLGVDKMEPQKSLLQLLIGNLLVTLSIKLSVHPCIWVYYDLPNLNT